MKPVVIAKRRAAVRISEEQLQKLLPTKDGIFIDAIIQDVEDFIRGSYSIIIHGDGLPDNTVVKEGEMARYIYPEDVFAP